MTFIVVIPARFGSTRLPGKPLLDLGGRPMVQRVWERARASSASRVVVATDDARIVEAAQGFGAEVLLTDASHPSGTDRLQQVSALLDLPDDAVVVNVQGDEPLIPPAVIDQVAGNLLARPDAAVATLCEPIESVEDLLSPNVVKVVADDTGSARYFSRAPIPWPREAFARDQSRLPDEGRWLRHIGIYAYRVAFLRDYVGWAPAPPECLEQLEQLRALHHGAVVHVAEAVERVPGGVDTRQDLERVQAQFKAMGAAT